MSREKYFDILEKVYQLTNNTAPRSFDCGELCSKRCCYNLSKSENLSGMALLPYEKEFLTSKGAKYSYDKNEDGDILVCDGGCDRNLRPFACRIFPYYIDILDDGIEIKKDLRAASVCPLLTNEISKRPSIYFLRSIKKAARLLMSEKVFRDELDGISGFIGYLHELYAKMEK